MAWKVSFERKALKDLHDLDPQVARRILEFLNGRLAKLDDPRSIGEALKGPSLNDYWKYRVGDYRIFARIEDRLINILVVRIGNRREIYR